ncbi:unnamed protein product [Caenorhabditis auriculariae]|uniref:Mediator of RNA polymerase II transcription subunit 13 n=1 Tax=Caenorhabditis auriculariae TaxID=2777116 RepID=A0A8S1HH94_9PELO|nr:unnamed protein product [Caenorhabditis auriculariae]
MSTNTPNGGSLEDCLSNIHSLTEVNGLKWRCYRTPKGATNVMTVTEDPILVAYSKCLATSIMCAWRRRPLNLLPTDGLPIPMFNSFHAKELFIFWYNDMNPEIEKIAEGLDFDPEDAVNSANTNNSLSYEVRVLYFKALSILIDRCLMKIGYVRFGRWFVNPMQPRSKEMHFMFPTYTIALHLDFFVHGGNQVCTSISAQRQPTLIRLHKRHLEYDSLKRRITVLVGPWSMRGYLVRNQLQLLSQPEVAAAAERIYAGWKQFIELSTEETVVEESVEGPAPEISEVPKMVLLEIDNIRMFFPSVFVCVTLEDDRLAWDALGFKVSTIPDELSVPGGTKPRNKFIVSNASSSMAVQGIFQSAFVNPRKEYRPVSVPVGGFAQPFPLIEEKDCRWTFTDKDKTECSITECLACSDVLRRAENGESLMVRREVIDRHWMSISQETEDIEKAYHRKTSAKAAVRMKMRERQRMLSGNAGKSLMDSDVDDGRTDKTDVFENPPDWSNTVAKEMNTSIVCSVEETLTSRIKPKVEGEEEEVNQNWSPFTPINALSPATEANFAAAEKAEKEKAEAAASAASASPAKTSKGAKSKATTAPPTAAATTTSSTGKKPRELMPYHSRRGGEKRKSTYPPVFERLPGYEDQRVSSPDEPGSQETIPAKSSPPPETLSEEPSCFVNERKVLEEMNKIVDEAVPRKKGGGDESARKKEFPEIKKLDINSVNNGFKEELGFKFESHKDFETVNENGSPRREDVYEQMTWLQEVEVQPEPEQKTLNVRQKLILMLDDLDIEHDIEEVISEELPEDGTRGLGEGTSEQFIDEIMEVNTEPPYQNRHTGPSMFATARRRSASDEDDIMDEAPVSGDLGHSDGFLSPPASNEMILSRGPPSVSDGIWPRTGGPPSVETHLVMNIVYPTPPSVLSDAQQFSPVTGLPSSFGIYAVSSDSGRVAVPGDVGYLEELTDEEGVDEENEDRINIKSWNSQSCSSHVKGLLGRAKRESLSKYQRKFLLPPSKKFTTEKMMLALRKKGSKPPNYPKMLDSEFEAPSRELFGKLIATEESAASTTAPTGFAPMQNAAATPVVQPQNPPFGTPPQMPQPQPLQHPQFPPQQQQMFFNGGGQQPVHPSMMPQASQMHPMMNQFPGGPPNPMGFGGYPMHPGMNAMGAGGNFGGPFGPQRPFPPGLHQMPMMGMNQQQGMMMPQMRGQMHPNMGPMGSTPGRGPMGAPPSYQVPSSGGAPGNFYPGGMPPFGPMNNATGMPAPYPQTSVQQLNNFVNQPRFGSGPMANQGAPMMSGVGPQGQMMQPSAFGGQGLHGSFGMEMNNQGFNSNPNMPFQPQHPMMPHMAGMNPGMQSPSFNPMQQHQMMARQQQMQGMMAQNPGGFMQPQPYHQPGPQALMGPGNFGANPSVPAPPPMLTPYQQHQQLLHQQLLQKNQMQANKDPARLEGDSVALAVMLSDTILDLHYDSFLDACPLCSCNVTIRGRELGLYITPHELLRNASLFREREISSWSGFSTTNSGSCTCGFSAVRHRYLSFCSGLFPDDSIEATALEASVASVTPMETPSQGVETSKNVIWFDPASTNDLMLLDQLRMLSYTHSFGKAVSQMSSISDFADRASKAVEVGMDVSSTAEYVISQVDSKELHHLGSSVIDFSLRSSGNRTSGGSSQNKFLTYFHPWGLQIANETREPTSLEWKIALDAVTPALEEAMRIARNITSPTGRIVEGPLSWKDIVNKSLKTKTVNSEIPDEWAAAPEPFPGIVLSTEKEAVRATPQLLQWSENAKVGPIDQPKDVMYIALVPDCDAIHDKAAVFMEELSTTYERMRLGRHIPWPCGYTAPPPVIVPSETATFSSIGTFLVPPIDDSSDSDDSDESSEEEGPGGAVGKKPQGTDDGGPTDSSDSSEEDDDESEEDTSGSDSSCSSSGTSSSDKEDADEMDTSSPYCADAAKSQHDMMACSPSTSSQAIEDPMDTGETTVDQSEPTSPAPAAQPEAIVTKDGLVRVGGPIRPPNKYSSSTAASSFEFNNMSRYIDDKTGFMTRLRIYTQQMEESLCTLFEENPQMFERDAFCYRIAHDEKVKAAQSAATAAQLKKNAKEAFAAANSSATATTEAEESGARDSGSATPPSVDPNANAGTPPSPSGDNADAATEEGDPTRPAMHEPMSEPASGSEYAKTTSLNPMSAGSMPQYHQPTVAVGAVAMPERMSPQNVQDAANMVEPEDIPFDDPGTLPHVIVVYMVNPFTWGPDSRSAFQMRVAILSFIRAFNSVVNRLPPKKRAQVQLEIIGLEHMDDTLRAYPDYFNGFKMPMELCSRTQNVNTNDERDKIDGFHLADVLRSIVTAVFTQPRILNPDCYKSMQPRVMTAFGPGSALIRIIEEMEVFGSDAYNCGPTLAMGKDMLDQFDMRKERVPVQYKVPSNILQLSPSTPLIPRAEGKVTVMPTEEMVLYVSYCLVGRHFLCAAVTDELGRIVDNCVINLRPRVDSHHTYRYRQKTQILDAMGRLWTYVLGVLSSDVRNWRLVIGRLGRIGHGEFKAWQYLLSKNSLQKYSARLKDICTACSQMQGVIGTPSILSACLVTIEPEPNVRVFYDLIDEEQTGKSKNKMTTPDDISCTHILTFPIGADINLDMADQTVEKQNDNWDDFNLEGLDIDLTENDMNELLNVEPTGMQPTSASRVGAGQIFFQDEVAIEYLNQPLASGFYISTSPAPELPDWFWSSCPSAKRSLPVHLKSSLHINVPEIKTDDISMESGSKEKEKEKEKDLHPLESHQTEDVLRHVLETYNALSWLNVNPRTGERLSCLPIHMQHLLRLYHTIARLII